MKIFNFVEGAWPRQGGVGIGCVPKIGLSLAASGVRVVLVSGGPATPGYESLVRPDVAAAARNQVARGSFGIVSVRSWGKFAFSPAIFWRVGRQVRNADVIALHSVYSFPVLAGYMLARIWRKPYILWPHGVLTPYMRRIGRRKKWIYDCLVGRSILRRAAAVICTGESERREVEELRLTTRTVVIPHGISLKSYDSLPPRGQFRARFLGGHQGPLILYLGRLAAVKNLELLVAAFAAVVRIIPDVKLALVGPPDPPAFQRTVTDRLRQHGVSRQVVLTGAITDIRAKQEALVDSDLFIMPSHSENFCHALFEAMAARLPSIVSDSINYAPEVVKHNAGLALSPDPEVFAGRIIALLRDTERRRGMGENARQLVAGYTWEKCGERLGMTLRSVKEGQPLPADLTLRRTPALEPAQ